MQNAARISRAVLRIVPLAAAAALVAGLLAAPVRADPADPDAPGGVVVTPAARHDTSPPLRDLAPGAAHHTATPMVAPTIDVNVDGLGAGISGGPYGVPPDTNSAVGLTQVVEVVNTALGVFTKRGALQFGPVPINQIFAGFGGRCQDTNDGDPIVRHDNLANRFVVTQFVHFSAPFGLCVAVSATSDATGAWHRYFFQSPDSPDGEKLGVWPDGYYVTTNGTYQGLHAPACVWDRAKMLNGQPATEQCFATNKQGTMPLPSDLDGTTPPPVGAPNIVGAPEDIPPSTDGLLLWKFHVDWATPANSTLTGPTRVAIDPWSYLTELIPQPGTTQGLTPNAFNFRLAYRNFGDHESLVISHSSGTGGLAAPRWYELRLPGGDPVLHQQGVVAPGDGVHRWMSSPAMDKFGNMALGYSVSSATVFPGIRYSSRLATDPLGQMAQGETTIINGNGSQTGTFRWGDYSSMSVDPVDDCTFWYSTEYYGETSGFGWRTRLASFRFPDCQPPTPVVVFSDDFETDRGWVANAGGADTATSGRLERGNPDATTSGGTIQLGTTVSGSNDLVTGRLAGTSVGANDVDGGTTTIRSPQIALPAAPATLQLAFSWYLAHANNASTADYLKITVIPTSGPTQTLFQRLGAPSQVNGAWQQATVDLSTFAGQTVRLQVEAADLSTASLLEAGVDDVTITKS